MAAGHERVVRPTILGIEEFHKTVDADGSIRLDSPRLVSLTGGKCGLETATSGLTPDWSWRSGRQTIQQTVAHHGITLHLEFNLDIIGEAFRRTPEPETRDDPVNNRTNPRALGRSPDLR
jgi:hypothetical protein